jgi:hypothetical protein
VGFLVPFVVVAASAAAAWGASVRLHVVHAEVLVEKVYRWAEVALKHFWSLLICLFVSLPVCLLDKWLFATCAKVLVLFAAGPGLLVCRNTGLEVILLLRSRLLGWPSFYSEGTGVFYWAWEVSGLGRWSVT